MHQRRWLSLAGLLAATVMALATSPRRTTLKAFVRVTESRIVIANRDTFDWTDVSLSAEPCIETLHFPVLRAGSVTTISLEDLRSTQGTRFDPRKHDIGSLRIAAKVGSRRRGDFSWKPTAPPSVPLPVDPGKEVTPPCQNRPL